MPLRGPMNASTVSSQEAYRSGPFPPGCLRRPSSSPMSAGARLPGRAPASEGRSRTPCSRGGAAGELADGPVPAERGDRVAGPGDAPGGEPPGDEPRRRRATAARTAPVTATRGVGVPGHACAVRPCSTAVTHRTLNGGTRPPVMAAASRAAAHASQASPARPHAAASSTQASAALPAANGGRGPSARLTAASAAARRGWPGLLQELPGVRDTASTARLAPLDAGQGSGRPHCGHPPASDSGSAPACQVAAGG